MKINTREIDLGLEVDGVSIEKAILTHLSAPLNRTFRISLTSLDTYRGVVVELVSEEHTGYGEASPIPTITGEISSSTFEMICYLLGELKGRKYGGLEDMLLDTSRLSYFSPGAMNAIDMALHDLLGKVHGIHVTRLLGGSLKTVLSTLTVGIGSVESSMKELESFLAQGAKIIKVKVGKDVNADIERVRAISERLGTISFFVDANQGYSLSDAVKMSRVLEECGAQFFEQPMDRRALSKMRDLRSRTSIPIMLDESICEPFDVIRAIEEDSLDMVNVKLAKSGGIRGAIKALTVAQSYGLDAMVGCMIETKLGISASLSVVSSMGNVKYADLDGFTNLLKQPFEDGVSLENGLVSPSIGNGLACRPAPENW